MTKRCSCTSPPLAALTPLLLLLLVCFSHRAAAARLLPAAVPLLPRVHQGDGVKAAAADVPVLQGVAAGNGDDELSQMAGAEEVEEACPEEGSDDECMQRRLLRDAHLDYIYTQHKGKP